MELNDFSVSLIFWWIKKLLKILHDFLRKNEDALIMQKTAHN